MALLFWGCATMCGIAQTAGLVDDFDGDADPAFAGTYAAYGENALGAAASQESTAQAHSPTHSRFLEQTHGGGQAWGIVAKKTLSAVADASAYADGSLDVWFYSETNDGALTFDVNLTFEVSDGGDGISVYSLKDALEPTLAAAWSQWTKLSIPLTSGSFDVENFGDFDLGHIKEFEFLIRNNGQTPTPAAKIYFDDIQFVASADTIAPTIAFVEPDAPARVFPTATPTIMGQLSDDDSGVDPSSLTISIDGVVQSGVLALPESFSYTPASGLSEGTVHTTEVVVSDNAGNSQTNSATFEVDTSLPPRAHLLNSGLEYGDGIVVANWGKFGDSAQENVDARTGDYHARVTGNYPGNGSANYTGFYQVLDASPGETWSASVYARVASAMEDGAEGVLQLVYVDGSETTLPGGVNNSAIRLDHTTPVGPYTELTVEGQAPAGTEGVKVVLLFIQSNDAGGLVYFDDASVVQSTPSGPALAADSLVDDFDNRDQYHLLQQNDLGYYTDDDATLADENVTAEALLAQWTDDAYWYTLFSAGDSSANLASNQYLALRYRGHAGGETFDISLRDAGGFSAAITCNPIEDTAQHTVNYPLSQFSAQGLNLASIRSLSLGFAAATPGTISIDGIGLVADPRPDFVSLSAPTSVTGSAPFVVEITASDGGGILADFNGSLNLSVSDGTVSPSTVTGFVNGVASVEVTVDGAIQVTLAATDMVGAKGTAELEVDTIPPPPMLDNPGFEEGSGALPDDWGRFGASSRLDDDPRTGSYHGSLTGNNPGDGSANYSGFYQVLPAAPGQTWRGSAFAEVATTLDEGNEARLQLIYVDGDGVTVPGGVNNSINSFDHTSSTGIYTQFTAEGRAPVGTEGVKLVLLFVQSNDGNGVVYFDDAEMTEMTPTGTELPADVIVDDFDDDGQYRLGENDLGYYTDDDATLSDELVAGGALRAGWTNDAYWYTLLAPTDGASSLTGSDFLALRHRGYAGGEAFDVSLREDGGFSASFPATSFADTNWHTVNYPLSQFTELGLNLASIRSLSLGFAAATPGTISLDAVALSPHPHAETITVSAPAVVTGGVPFEATITMSAAGGTIADYDGIVNLSVSAGVVSPSSVAVFEEGVATVQVTVDEAVEVILLATDELGGRGTAALQALAPPPVPTALLSNIKTNGIELLWEASPGATGYRIYRSLKGGDPKPADLLTTINGASISNHIDFSVNPQAPYFYRVTATNDYGESGFSGPAMGTVFSHDWGPNPDTVGGLSRLARSENGRLLLHTADGDVGFIAGINIGATIPGHSPGELAIGREFYQRWFSQIAGLGIRLVRVYTLLSPGFYEELRAYNLANPQAPLYLQHGVWLIEEELFVQTRDLFHPDVVASFKEEIEDVVAAVHGDLEREYQPGRAWGSFTADVSPWLMSYIVGIEMEPHAVYHSDILNAGQPAYSGTYFESAPAASPTERWYAEMFDHAATEIAARGLTIPLAHGNWPTTDPLDHPDEPIPEEDLVGVDVNHVLPTAAWPGGRFANYHIYPYYPDAVRFEDGITNFLFRGHIDNYAGYITKIVNHHATADCAVVISEFGVPSSMGNAHYGPLGRDQGGHSEQAQMAIDRDLLDILRNVGCSGGSLFMWLDEWFKTTWNLQDIHKPTDRRWFWRNPWCNEANFGIVAAEAGSKQIVILDGDDSEWDDNKSEVIFTGSGDIEEVRAVHDEGYLYLRVKTADPEVWVNDQLAMGFDVLAAGNQGLPGHPGMDTNAEYAITFGPSPSEPIAQAYQATWNDFITIEYGLNTTPPYFEVDPASVEEGSGSWTQQLLIVSRRLTVPTTGQEMPPEYHPVGELRHGTSNPQDPAFDQRTAWSASGSVLEVRVPYSMLGYGDPSSHQAYRVQMDGSVALVDAPDVGISLVLGGQEFQTSGYTWDAWNEVEWHERLKADIEVYAQAVVDVNHNYQPSIDSPPVETVRAGDTYQYDIEAGDGNTLEMLTYSLVHGPTGMTVNATNGLVAWETSGAVLGDHSVEVKVSDTLGLYDTQSYTVSVEHFTLHLAYDPETGIDSFPQAEAEQSNYTGSASIWMTAKYLWNTAYTYDQDQIYAMTAHDPAHNGEITPQSYASHLTSIDFPNYNFAVRTVTNMTRAIQEAIYWIDYLPPGGKHAPGAMLSGANWAYKIIRGFQTDEKPYLPGSSASDITVFGVWVNDPTMGGLGHNVFVPANGFAEVFLPSDADGNYYLVAEPPSGSEYDDYMADMEAGNLLLNPPKTSSEMADALQAFLGAGAGGGGRSNNGDGTVEESLHSMLAAVLPDALLEDGGFISLFEKTQTIRSYAVNRDVPAESYVLLAGVILGPASTAFIAKMNADDGSISQMAWGEPSRYLPIDRDAAIWVARKHTGDPDAELVRAELVYTADTCASALLPRWKVELLVGGLDTTVHVPQGADLSTDMDGDGQNDGDELYAGTDPDNKASVLSISGVSQTTGGAALRWSSVADRTYSISHSGDLMSDFVPLITGVPATPPINVYTTQPPSSLTFYRIDVE